MKRYLLNEVAGTALMVGAAWAQSSTQTPAPGSTAAEAQRHSGRVENQKDRIQQGVKSGQLTPQQAQRLGRQEGRTKAEANRMKANNGGQLSQKQEARLHQQTNRQSPRVYGAKH